MNSVVVRVLFLSIISPVLHGEGGNSRSKGSKVGLPINDVVWPLSSVFPQVGSRLIQEATAAAYQGVITNNSKLSAAALLRALLFVITQGIECTDLAKAGSLVAAASAALFRRSAFTVAALPGATLGIITPVSVLTIRFKFVGFVAAAAWLASTVACMAAAFPGASRGIITPVCVLKGTLLLSCTGIAGGCHVARVDVGDTPSTFANALPPGSCLWLGNLDSDEKDEGREKEKEEEKGEVSGCLPVHASRSSCPISFALL